MDSTIGTVFVICALTVLLIACTPVGSDIPTPKPISHTYDDRYTAFRKMMDQNPCGVLRMKKPVFNVTGRLTERVHTGTYIYLSPAPNISGETAMHVAHNCRPLVRELIDENGCFGIKSMPAGNFVAIVPTTSYRSEPGIPIINEFNEANHTVTMGFYGFDSRYSVAAFSIQPESLKDPP